MLGVLMLGWQIFKHADKLTCKYADMQTYDDNIEPVIQS